MKKRGNAIAEALRVQKAAARQGFDWNRSAPLWAKLREETIEFREVAHLKKRGEEELGDLLFMVVNLARHYRLNPERALAAGNRKFLRRYGYILKRAKGLPPLGSKRRLTQMEKLWVAAKKKGL